MTAGWKNHPKLINAAPTLSGSRFLLLAKYLDKASQHLARQDES